MRSLPAWLGLLLVLLTGACDSLLGSDRYAIQDIALSPDGALVAVRFVDHDEKRGGLGLYDWRRDRFTAIPTPPGRDSFTDPSFSPDGSRLAAVLGNQIVIIDPERLTWSRATDGSPGFRAAPMFQPDANKILYVASNPARLILLDLDSHIETTVLPGSEGFGSLSRPFFGANDRIIFLATNPKDSDLQQQLAQFPDSRPETDSHFYGVKFGAKPELILKNLWVEGKKRSRWFTGEHNMQASKDGKTIVFLDVPASQKGPDANIDQEVFAIEDGALKQLTSLHAALNSAAISYDGGTVAFTADPAHGGNFTLYIIDLATGKTRSTGLLGSLHLATSH